MLTKQTITFLGAGAMAEALIAGLIKNEIVEPKQIIATNQSNHERLTKLQQSYAIRTTNDKQEAIAEADLIILAMKPKNVSEALTNIRDVLSKNQLIISVIAGISTAYIEDELHFQGRVIRTMPNTSAKVGESATAISRGSYSTKRDLEIVSHLFTAVGTVTVVDEEKMNTVTGVAGSGPAYFYYLIEAMENAAIESGLSVEEAKMLITQTVVGVGKRLQHTSKTPSELYKEVMSPNGTTEAGIHLLNERKAQAALHDAVIKAIHRSAELGNVFSKTK